MNIKKNLQLVCIKFQMFWKFIELVAAYSPTRAVSWVIHPQSGSHVHLWTVASQLVRPNTPHPVSLQYSSVCSSSMKAFWSFVVLGHSLVLLLRLRSFPPTTYSVTRLGKTEFLVPFSCLHQAALSSFPNKTVVDKVSKGNKWLRQVRLLSEHYWEVKSSLKLP